MNISTFTLKSTDYKFDLNTDKDKDYVYFDKKELPTIDNPPYITPHISLTPFDFRILPLKRSIGNQVKVYFGDKFSIYPRATNALYAFVKHTKIKSTQNIAIYKTFDNDFISRCVTDTITKKCNLKRKIDKNTRAVMVIHEFGHPYKQIADLQRVCTRLSLPLIENCAWVYDHNLGSKDRLGSFGDYVLYSLPKIIPSQHGGILVGLKNDTIKSKELSGEKAKIIIDRITTYMPNIKKSNATRRRNWRYLESLFSKLGYKPLINLEDKVYPSVFLVKSKNYRSLYDKYLRYGVETGRYYHEGALYLPIHQNLTKSHLDYIFAVYNSNK